MKNADDLINKMKEFLITQETWLLLRASLENIPINLVTAVPSIETYNNIVNKKYYITKLKKRYKEASITKY